MCGLLGGGSFRNDEPLVDFALVGHEAEVFEGRIEVYSLFGQTIRSQVAGLAAEMAGQSANTALQAAKKSADSAVQKADNKHGLNDYNAENH